MAEKIAFDFQDDALRDKTVLVAGGTGGLGSATVALLARQGARLVVGYRENRNRAEALAAYVQERWGGDIRLVEGDIADESVRRRLVSAAEKSLFGLVSFTGTPARVKFNEATAEDLAVSLEENYMAPVLLAREAAEAMRAAGEKGAVVFISSMQAVAPFDSSLNYAGPKATLLHAARILARQWGGPEEIRVNVIAPGVNRAGMALESIASGKYDRFVQEGIIPRFGRPEDVARVVRLLLQPDNYITGQVITVDGGFVLRRDR